MKDNSISRRTFTAGMVAAGVAASNANNIFAEDAKPDIVSASGTNSLKNLEASLKPFGGMKAFVKPGQKVNLLTNTIGRFPGTITSPELIRATVALCKKAGAAEVRWTDWRTLKRLDENKLAEVTKDEDLVFEHFENGDDTKWMELDVPRGNVMKKIDVYHTINDADVFIAMPIIKHHGSANFTGALKIMMGVTRPATNRNQMHGSKKLEECIAEINTAIRKPDLYIMDAMKTIVTGGPTGPGKTIEPKKIIVGFDPVALDAYASPLINIDPAASTQIQTAHKLGVGEADLKKLNIKEIQV